MISISAMNGTPMSNRADLRESDIDLNGEDQEAARQHNLKSRSSTSTAKSSFHFELAAMYIKLDYSTCGNRRLDNNTVVSLIN